MWAVILKFSINTLKGFICTIIQSRKQNAQQFYFKPQLYSNSHIKLFIFSNLRNYIGKSIWAVILKFCMNT